MLALIPKRGYSTHMEKLQGAEKLYKGLTAEDLSDLSGIDAEVIAFKMAHPRDFTLREVVDIAPHLGLTADMMVARVLDWA